MRSIIILNILFITLSAIHAQPKEINLVQNGDFEKGNTGFWSDFFYDDFVSPGAYAITYYAPLNNGDFAPPVHGDRTSGRGRYMVCNFNGRSGKKIWNTEVNVEPNSMYEFSAYFCNIYRLLPPKTNFAYEEADTKGNDPELALTVGPEVVAVEKDFYHLFRWIRVSGTWYSGKHQGKVKLGIENLNTAIVGNDLALDDVAFTFLQTMPEGYEPPRKTITVVDKNYVPKDTVIKPSLSSYGEFDLSDSISEGIYVMRYKPWHPIVIDPVVKNEKIELRDLIFLQAKPDLLPQAKAQLDLIAEWMTRDSLIRIRLIGHTDNQGDALLNVKLSEQRVLNAKEYLVAKGINATRVETVGYGGEFPIADNSREESRKLNRRVEMEILNQ